MTATTDLIAALPVASVRFLLESGQEMSGQASGAVRTRDLRPALWTAEVRTTELDLDELAAAQALIEGLDGGIGHFQLWNPARQYPIADPEGTIVGSSSVTIAEIGSDGRSLALDGLPAGYVLSRGDLFAVTFGAGLYRALYRIVSAGATADSTGETDPFEVRPHVWAGTAVADPVNLKRPAAAMAMVPGSVDIDAAGPFATIAFRAVQVLALS